MTNAGLEEYVWRFNFGLLECVQQEELSPLVTVVSVKQKLGWPADNLYFYRDVNWRHHSERGEFVGVVYDMGESDFHCWTKEYSRRGGSCYEALNEVVLPRFKALGREVQSCTYCSKESKALLKKLGFKCRPITGDYLVKGCATLRLKDWSPQRMHLANLPLEEL